MTHMTHRHNLPYILPSQAQKHLTHNEALRQIDAIAHLSVSALDADAPPQDPVSGQSLAIGEAPTGIFSNFAHHIAAYIDGAWQYYPMLSGMVAWNEPEQTLYVYSQPDWKKVSEDPEEYRDQFEKIGINTQSNDYNKLSVKTPAVLLTADEQSSGPDIRLNINKASENGTASLTFQDNYSARAELGLTGDNHFQIKVSPDGANFKSALQVRADYGFVGIGKFPTDLLDLRCTGSGVKRLAIDNQTSEANSGTELKLSSANQNLTLTLYNGSSSYLVSSSSTFVYKLTGASAAHCFNLGSAQVLTVEKTRVTFKAPAKLHRYTLATLPLATQISEGSIVYVSDSPTGATLALSDGSNWRSVQTGAIL